MSEVLSFEAAVDVYKILIKLCNASPHTDHMTSFIFNVSKPWPTAVTFHGKDLYLGGSLGPGANFVRCNEQWYVFQHKTNLTAQTAANIEEINKKLAIVRAKHVPNG